MAFEVKDLLWAKDALRGISEKTIETHHDKLYAGYVNKRNEIESLLPGVDRSAANQAYSAYRALKLEEDVQRRWRHPARVVLRHSGWSGRRADGVARRQDQCGLRLVRGLCRGPVGVRHGGAGLGGHGL